MPIMSEVSPPPLEEKKINGEDIFASLFKTSASGTGEEELLRIGAGFSRQITGRQIKKLCLLAMVARRCNESTRINLENFIDRYMELKQYNQSKEYVMRMFDSIALRKYINSDAMKINVTRGN